MIKYSLNCKNCDLTFESWFASSKEYEKLKKKKFLNCHNCNSFEVEKSLMAPSLINKNYKDNKKKQKGIYGTASKQELKELKEEGIDAQMIPWVEDKSN